MITVVKSAKSPCGKRTRYVTEADFRDFEIGSVNIAALLPRQVEEAGIPAAGPSHSDGGRGSVTVQSGKEKL
jgi:hypothetical protein